MKLQSSPPMSAGTEGPVPVISARTLIPFVDFVRDLGAPVDRWIEKCRLPSLLCEDPDAYISTLKHWEFVSLSAHHEGIDDLGLRVGCDRGYDVLGPRVIQGVISAPTLLCGMEEFAHLVLGESSATRVWFTKRGKTVHLCLKKALDPGTPGYRQTEWLAVVVLIKVVQLFAGRQWQPECVFVQSRKGPPELAARLFPDVRFLTGQSHCSISFPGDLLHLAPRLFGSEEVAKRTLALEELAPMYPPSTFAQSLQQLAIPYLRGGYPSLGMIAEVIGMSQRTLQRRLAHAGLNFSAVIDRARFTVASDLLRNTECTSVEVARATGYEDPSHFARAFRRTAGCSPRQFRSRSGASKTGSQP